MTIKVNIEEDEKLEYILNGIWEDKFSISFETFVAETCVSKQTI